MDLLVTRWREKVFECLLTNKRYEVIIKDNLRKYKQEVLTIEKEKKEGEV
jgi:hypothetical protein